MKPIYLLFALLLLPACGPKEPVLTRQYELRGHCLFWEWNEKKRAGQEKCYIPWPSDSAVECTLEEGHKRKHHAHYGEQCVAAWRD